MSQAVEVTRAVSDLLGSFRSSAADVMPVLMSALSEGRQAVDGFLSTEGMSDTGRAVFWTAVIGLVAWRLINTQTH